MLEAGPDSSDPIARFVFRRQANDVESLAIAEIGDRTRVVDADARVLGQALVGPLTESDLLAIDPARRLRHVFQNPSELGDEEPGEPAADERGGDPPPCTNECSGIAGQTRQTSETDEPARGEWPQVPQTIP